MQKEYPPPAFNSIVRAGKYPPLRLSMTVLSRISKLEHAVPEEDREDYAALQIQRTYRRVTRARKVRKGLCA